MNHAGSTELDKLIKLQNKEYYELYDTLAKNLKKKDQIEILRCNNQMIPETKYEVNSTIYPMQNPYADHSYAFTVILLAVDI